MATQKVDAIIAKSCSRPDCEKCRNERRTLVELLDQAIARGGGFVCAVGFDDQIVLWLDSVAERDVHALSWHLKRWKD